MQNTTKKIVNKIYGHRRGWAFSQKDFSSFGNRSAIDISLHRLEIKKTIRRVIRGIYDYPLYSKKLGQTLSPDVDQVAQAISRKFGWNIQPSGPAALNILGLSTQVQAKYIYQSSGPDRSYKIGNTELVFQSTPSKEAGFKYHESAIIVQALKSLGPNRITIEIIGPVRDWLKTEMRPKILKDTQTVTGWLYEAIRKICQETGNG